MALIKFSDWLLNVKESSPITRLRQNAALGLMPPLPDASLNSKSSATPFQLSQQKKLHKKKKKHKKKLDEVFKNKKLDDFINAVGLLKKDTEVSAEKLKDKEKKDKEADKKTPIDKEIKDDKLKNKDKEDKDQKDDEKEIEGADKKDDDKMEKEEKTKELKAKVKEKDEETD